MFLRLRHARPVTSSSFPSTPSVGFVGVFSAARTRGDPPRRRRNAAAVHIPRATGADDEPPSDEPSSSSSRVGSPSSLPTSIADSKVFNTYLHGAVFVFILGFIDAGYSGDWSRIGAISVDTEDRLKALAVILGELHIAAAAAAGAVARARGLPVAPAAAKTLLVGFLALLEVCFKTVPPDTGRNA